MLSNLKNVIVLMPTKKLSSYLITRICFTYKFIISHIKRKKIKSLGIFEMQVKIL